MNPKRKILLFFSFSNAFALAFHFESLHTTFQMKPLFTGDSSQVSCQHENFHVSLGTRACIKHQLNCLKSRVNDSEDQFSKKSQNHLICDIDPINFPKIEHAFKSVLLYSGVLCSLLLPSAAFASESDLLGSIQNLNLDWGKYAFMFPVSIFVATLSQLAGIGGAALFAPIFVILFPLLGPNYPLASTQASVATALLTEAFGFSSGLVGYFLKGLVDVRSALPFMAVAVPMSLLGGEVVGSLDEFAVKGFYAVLMLGLSYIFLKSATDPEIVNNETASLKGYQEEGSCRIQAKDGTVYEYQAPFLDGFGYLLTAIGGFITGVAGVGIGEVVVPQLTQKNDVPVPVASGTSILIVFITALAAAYAQITGLLSASDVSIGVVPWNLVCYTVPGVLIGGQLAPNLQGVFDSKKIELIFSTLFCAVGSSFGFITVKHFLHI